MAQNTAEDTKSSVDKTDVSETATTDNTVLCYEKKDEVINADKTESTVKETADATEKNKVVKSTDLVDSKGQLDTRATDHNGDSKKEEISRKSRTEAGQDLSKKINAAETVEDDLTEPCSSSEMEHTSSQVDALICGAEKRLSEIIKVVHGGLSIENFQKSIHRSTIAKNDIECNSERKRQTLEKIAPIKDAAESVKECSASAVQDAEKKKDLRRPLKKTEKPEVGLRTDVSKIINEDELGDDTALSADEKGHVAKWIENSVKVDMRSSASIEEKDHFIEEPKRLHKKNVASTRAKQGKMVNDALVSSTKKSQRIINSIIKKSIKCLNKMHAMENAGGNGKNVDAAERTPREDESPRSSPNVPQSQQNGAALPEETATSPTAMDCVHPAALEKDSRHDVATNAKSSLSAGTSQRKTSTTCSVKTEPGEVTGKKRKSVDEISTNGPSTSKKLCLEEREQHIATLTACDKNTPEEFVAKANQLQAEIQALDKLARAKEREWNEILRMRKLKEEAYLRIERKRHVIDYMESSSDLPESLPPARISLSPKWDNTSDDNTTTLSKEKSSGSKEEGLSEEGLQETTAKKQKMTKVTSQRRTTPPKTSGANSRKQNEGTNLEYRQIGEGRQGAILDVTSIIAKHREEHPESVPRRGRRMRNSVNIGLTAGGAMVETGYNADSRPSSTDSCKSNPNTDYNNSMSFKDVLVQFAKLSQQQGEAIKTPQNYPDVTLHPVPPSPAQNTVPQQTGSLLHGILTKAQSPRPTTFSPTLARLLTAPERERNSPAAVATAVSMPQQSAATQHLLQAYQSGSNLGTISELLSSSKTRTEITITPVVNTPAQSHSNNMIHVEDMEEETTVVDDRDVKYSVGGKDREERDNPPRCQGCHNRAAQFVCAGCGNQWYCSRDCQVSAWDDHSEVCSG